MPDTAVATWWESGLLKGLEAICAVVLLGILCRLATEESLSWIAWVAAGIFLLLLIVARWPYGATLALVGTSVMPYFFVEIFGWKARPEHFASGIIFVVVVAWLLVGKRRARLDTLDYWILAYVAINFISSAFGSPAPASTLRWAFQNSLAILPYFLIRLLVQDRKVLQKTFRILLIGGFIESIYGICCYFSHQVFGSSVGIALNQYGSLAVPYGSQYEPNLFGAYTACGAVLFLALYLSAPQRRLRTFVGFTVTSLAMILSFSRAALFAFALVGGWVFWRARPSGNRRQIKVALFAIGLGAVVLVGSSAVGGVLQKRFADLFSEGLAEDTALIRYVVIAEALNEIPQHPLLGSGTSSLQLTFDLGQYVPEWAGIPTWVGNLTVRVLHDAGFLGLTMLLGFFISLCSRVRREIRGTSREIPILLGLWAGALLYCITFQSTDGTILAFPWIHFGLLASAVVILDDPNERQNAIGRSPSRPIIWTSV